MWWRKINKKTRKKLNRRANIFTTLGMLDTGDHVGIDWASPVNLAIQGMTRSGKSVATYSILSSLEPFAERVRVCMVDPTGVLGTPLQDHQIAGAMSLGTHDPDKALAVVVEVLDIIRQRMDMLTRERRDKWNEWIPSRPLVLLVLEELPGIVEWLQDDDQQQGRKTTARLAPKFLACVRQIMAQGLKVGVAVLALAQRFDASIISGPARANIAVRICLRVDDADSVRMLFPGASVEVVNSLASMSPGRGLLTAPGHHMTRVRLNYLEYSEYCGVWGVTPSMRGVGRSPTVDSVPPE